MANRDDLGELQLLATVSTGSEDEAEEPVNYDDRLFLALTAKEEKWQEEDDDDDNNYDAEYADRNVEVADTAIDPDLLRWDLKDTLFITTKQSEQTHREYARKGFDVTRFKSLAAALVVEKEEEIARGLSLGNEKDVVMEESIECVPKTFLDDILTDGNDEQKLDQDSDALRIISVGELLSLLEV